MTDEAYTLETVEQEIHDHYQARTNEVIRVVGREAYLRSPVRIQEVGTLAKLWQLHDLLAEDAKAEMTSDEVTQEFGWAS